MKLEDLDKFIYEQDLLRDVEEKAGIYAITIDKRVVYVGQSKNIYQRCRSHIYNIFNAMYKHWGIHCLSIILFTQNI